MGTPPGEDTARLSKLFTDLTNGLFGLGMRRAIAARNQILDHITEVIQQRQQNPTDDALSLLIQAQDENGDRLSLEEIRAQAMLLLFAGHETTTALLTWVCLELARHPDVLETARAEQLALRSHPSSPSLIPPDPHPSPLTPHSSPSTTSPKCLTWSRFSTKPNGFILQ